MQVSTEEATESGKRDPTASYRFCQVCRAWHKIPANELKKLKKRRLKARCPECGAELELMTASSMKSLTPIGAL